MLPVKKFVLAWILQSLDPFFESDSPENCEKYTARFSALSMLLPPPTPSTPNEPPSFGLGSSAAISGDKQGMLNQMYIRNIPTRSAPVAPSKERVGNLSLKKSPVSREHLTWKRR